MTCDPIYGPDRRPIGVMCSGRGRKKAVPCACGRPSSLLCDGPGEEKKSCDAPICSVCAVGVRALNVDFCPKCAAQPPPLNRLCDGKSSLPCFGPGIEKDELCLGHALLFTWWLGNAGGYENVYSRADLTREQKRVKFWSWLQESEERARRLLHRLRTRLEALQGAPP